MDYLKSGDTAYFASFDRLSRKNLRLLSLIEEIKSKGVSIHFVEERIYLSPTIENPYDELNANIFAAFSDFFKKQLKVRQKEGIKAAREAKPDLYQGRKTALSLRVRKNILTKIILKQSSYAEIQARYSISRSTAWRVAYKDESLVKLRQECLKLRYENELKKLAQKNLKPRCRKAWSHTMNLDDVLRRLKKCLALTKSSNEFEAAAALRQVQTLMIKYNLTELDVQLSDINEHYYQTNHIRKKMVEVRLAQMVADVFECGFYIKNTKNKQFVFYGISPNTDIAVYSYEVLEPILMQAKKEYMATLHGNTKLKSKRALSKSFCLGWINSVRNKCERLNPNTDLQELLKKYENTKLNLNTFGFSEIEHRNKNKLNEARRQGYLKGETVNLFHAVNKDDVPSLNTIERIELN
ncbi:recombinase family protein [Acinetobacter beijerinckii]